MSNVCDFAGTWDNNQEKVTNQAKVIKSSFGVAVSTNSWLTCVSCYQHSLPQTAYRPVAVNLWQKISGTIISYFIIIHTATDKPLYTLMFTHTHRNVCESFNRCTDLNQQVADFTFSLQQCTPNNLRRENSHWRTNDSSFRKVLVCCQKKNKFPQTEKCLVGS